VNLTRDAQSHIRMVHNLVLEAFAGPRPEGHEADHIDFDRANNRLENLRWLPRNKNRGRIRRELLPRGERKAQAVLDTAAVEAIRASDDTLRSLAARYGVSHGHISQVRTGRKWAHVAGPAAASGRRRGERHSRALLDEAQVRAIRSRYAAGGVTYLALAGEYGVKKVTIAAIVARRIWKHVP
jgi:hypothetical protein